MLEGAVNVVPCSGSDADSMVVDERIGMISLTGSPEVGWGIKVAELPESTINQCLSEFNKSYIIKDEAAEETGLDLTLK